MNLRKLRAECPDWAWRPERYGFGWRYLGQREGRRVVVQAFSVLCGPGETDDAETQWRVDDGQTSRSYAAWWMSKCSHNPSEKG
jgi:hypothetical protein